MNNKISVSTPYKFFSASNGTEGFVNYFESTFSRQKHKKVYILKGGPGTGKSTIMKKLCAFADEFCIYNEAIYCSSDIESLDGVIIKKDSVSIAVFDGTAPHTSDTLYPGCRDLLIDLGRGFDECGLEKRTEEIVLLNKEKSAAYSNAYQKLSLIKEYREKNTAEDHGAKLEADRIFGDIKRFSSRECGTRLVSAFSKNGLTRLDTLERISEKIYRVDGDKQYGYSVLEALCKKLTQNGYGFIRVPTALFGDLTEAIYIPEERLSIIAYGASDSRSFEFSESEISTLVDAQRYLARASELHSELEAIYTPLMDFSYIDSIYADLLSKIKCQLRI